MGTALGMQLITLRAFADGLMTALQFFILSCFTHVLCKVVLMGNLRVCTTYMSLSIRCIARRQGMLRLHARLAPFWLHTSIT